MFTLTLLRSLGSVGVEDGVKTPGLPSAWSSLPFDAPKVDFFQGGAPAPNKTKEYRKNVYKPAENSSLKSVGLKMQNSDRCLELLIPWIWRGLGGTNLSDSVTNEA